MNADQDDIRTAIDQLGGAAEMARIWDINPRLGRHYYAGTRELPPKRRAQLVDALIQHSKRATELAARLAKSMEP